MNKLTSCSPNFFSLELLSDGFADVVIQCRGGSFMVHKLVLVASSPVLRWLLESEGCCSNNCLIFPDFEAPVVESLIRLMYSGQSQYHGSQLSSELNDMLKVLKMDSFGIFPSIKPEIRNLPFASDYAANTASAPNEITALRNCLVGAEKQFEFIIKLLELGMRSKNIEIPSAENLQQTANPTSCNELLFQLRALSMSANPSESSNSLPNNPAFRHASSPSSPYFLNRDNLQTVGEVNTPSASAPYPQVATSFSGQGIHGPDIVSMARPPFRFHDGEIGTQQLRFAERLLREMISGNPHFGSTQ